MAAAESPAAPLLPDAPALSADDAITLQRYQDSISEIESRGGAFAAGIDEQLLGLGQFLQRRGRHQEAVEIFKRGVHIARINGGLYSNAQIPLLRAEIRSLRALQDYDAVDDRQRYLYRVERRSIGEGGAFANALMRQGDWQRDAFLLEIDDPDAAPQRLIIMWDVYRLALNRLIEMHGSQAPELVPALEGMLTSQYMIAGYRGYENAHTTVDSQRLSVYTKQAYERGKGVLRALMEVHATNNGDDPVQRSRDLLRLGDWSWWFTSRRDAEQAYQEAWAVAMSADETGDLAHQLFAEPVALPAVKDLDNLPEPGGDPNDDLVVEFTVSETGRVEDFERLKEPDVEFDVAMSRLLRRIQRTRFRPRMVDGEPVETEGIVWSFNADDWQVMQ